MRVTDRDLQATLLTIREGALPPTSAVRPLAPRGTAGAGAAAAQPLFPRAPHPPRRGLERPPAQAPRQLRRPAPAHSPRRPSPALPALGGRLRARPLVAHLVHLDHSPAFWAVVNRYPLAERARGFLIACDFGLNADYDGDE